MSRLYIKMTGWLFLCAALIMAFLFLPGLATADTLSLPSGTQVIEEEAFYGDTSLDRIAIPEGLKRIESRAFAYSSLTSINIPDSVEYIADDAFTGTNLSFVRASHGTYGYEWFYSHQIVTDEEEDMLLLQGINMTTIQAISYERYTGNMGDSRIFNLDEAETVGLDGTVYKNGFGIWIARWNFTQEISWVKTTYSLNGKYEILIGKTSLMQSRNTQSFDTTLYFYDGDILLASYRITPDNYRYNVHVDVSGVMNLTIYAQDNIAAAGGTNIAFYNVELFSTLTEQDNHISVLVPTEKISINNSFTLSCIDPQHTDGDQYRFFILDGVTSIATSNWSTGQTAEFSLQNEGNYSVIAQKQNSSGLRTTSEEANLTVDLFDREMLQFSVIGCFDSHTYWLIENMYTPPQAERICQQLGGYLSAITTREELSFVNLLFEHGKNADYIIGASDYGTEGSWHWLNGEPWGYTNWNTGEPNNGLKSAPGGEDYSYAEKRNGWRWVDVFGSYDGYSFRRGFLCEFDSGHADTIHYSLSSDSIYIYDDFSVTILDDDQDDDSEYQAVVFNEERAYSSSWSQDLEKSFNIDEDGEYQLFIRRKKIVGGVTEICQTSPVSINILLFNASALNVAANGVYGESRYLLIENHYKPNQAERICTQLGGHLASITSEEENEYVMSLFDQGSDECYFIGATDRSAEGQWIWMNGEPLGFTYWHAGEPNNGHSSYLGGEDYCEVYKPDSWRWIDVFGRYDGFTVKWGFLCELSSDAPLLVPQVSLELLSKTVEDNIITLNIQLTINADDAFVLHYPYIYLETSDNLSHWGWEWDPNHTTYMDTNGGYGVILTQLCGRSGTADVTFVINAGMISAEPETINVCLLSQGDSWFSGIRVPIVVDMIGENTEPYTEDDRQIGAFNLSFRQNATRDEIDHVLANLSVKASLVCYRGFGTVKLYLQWLGFDIENIKAYDLTSGEHTAGHYIGVKTVLNENNEPVPLFAVVIRGTNGTYREWKSNFTPGNDTLHYGFSKATDIIRDNLNNYINWYYDNIDTTNNRNYKLWITGHSRGAACGNILAATFTGTSAANIYAYLFATPNTTKSPVAANNIKNFVFSNDAVPRVPPYQYGYDKNGTTYWINADNEILNGTPLSTEEGVYVLIDIICEVFPNPNDLFERINSVFDNPLMYEQLNYGNAIALLVEFVSKIEIYPEDTFLPAQILNALNPIAGTGYRLGTIIEEIYNLKLMNLFNAHPSEAYQDWIQTYLPVCY